MFTSTPNTTQKPADSSKPDRYQFSRNIEFDDKKEGKKSKRKTMDSNIN
jgi:hypothetical protein